MTHEPSVLYQRLAAIEPNSLALHGLATPTEAGVRPPLRFHELCHLIAWSGDWLREQGLTPRDRIALCLPNSPELAVLWLALVNFGCVLPLNPSFQPEELRFSLSDLRATAVVVAAGEEQSPVALLAPELGLTVLRLAPRLDQPIGSFSLHRLSPGRSVLADRAPTTSDSPALILHTSGTTARPKTVPLSLEQLITSGLAIGKSLALSPRDRLCGIMPLFHIHGLMAGLLAPLLAGSSIFVPPGFHGLKFLGWLQESEASWYTAVPTMHAMIVARAKRNPDLVASIRGKLRLIRSSSAALPPRLLAELESLFDCPVVEAYGMTEASHQMACTPLSPSHRQSGSVGTATGPEIAIMDESGACLPPHQVGEVVIRGKTVFHGYENNPTANQTAFTNGWFRTGDQGCLDETGHLRLLGRLTEIINRGGEKVSPLEVEAVASEMPEVAEAVCFPIPHPSLGEEVGLVVVLQPESQTTTAEITAFLATRLAAFKRPRQISITSEIPKTATGKVQRKTLAATLGYSSG
ncbi:MAG: AMP-binding protein [Alphaproteobacteria bacterium]|nr:AMP-binding protein [Alphaproteobacteria bacterium]